MRGFRRMIAGMIGALKSAAPQPLKAAMCRVARWLPRRPRPAILMYHRIASDSFDPWGLAVEERNFAAQLEWLARNRSVMPLTEFAKLHRAGRLPRDAIAITFDDGYASAMRVAPPLLERLGLHATVFLPVELIERGEPFWWDELAGIVLDFDGEKLRLEGSDIRTRERHERDRIWRPDAPPDTPRQVAFYAIWSKLRVQPPAAIEQAMNQLRSQAPRGKAVDGPADSDNLKSCLARGSIAFGSHALSHPSLPTLSEHEQAREIEQSRSRCASLTGESPTTFAYPYGDVDGATRRLVEGAGFECACTAEHAFVTTSDNAYALPRLRVGNCGPRGLRNMLRYA